MSARSFRSLARYQKRLKKLLLHCEKLEARELLASDLLAGDVSQDDSSAIVSRHQKVVEDRLVTLPPTHFYEVDGQEIGMVIYPNRVALALTSEDVDVAALGLQFVRGLDAEYSVYRSLDDSTIDTQSLLASGLVRNVVPRVLRTRVEVGSGAAG